MSVVHIKSKEAVFAENKTNACLDFSFLHSSTLQFPARLKKRLIFYQTFLFMNQGHSEYMSPERAQPEE